MLELTLGHFVEANVVFLDASGNPMLTAPKVDSPPVWTNTTPATETLVVAPDGLTAEGTTLAVGTDSIGVTVVVGGASFTASVAVTVDALPQVLTSVAINAVAK